MRQRARFVACKLQAAPTIVSVACWSGHTKHSVDPPSLEEQCGTEKTRNPIANKGRGIKNRTIKLCWQIKKKQIQSFEMIKHGRSKLRICNNGLHWPAMVHDGLQRQWFVNKVCKSQSEGFIPAALQSTALKADKLD